MDPFLLAIIAAVIIILLLVVRRRKQAEAPRRRPAPDDSAPSGPREATRKTRKGDKGIGHQKKVTHKKIRSGTRDEALVMLLEGLEALVVSTAQAVEDAPQVRAQWESARRGAERVRLATDEGPPADDADARELLALLMAGLGDVQDVRREVEGLPSNPHAPLLEALCQVNPAHGRSAVRVTAADQPRGVEVCAHCHDMLARGEAPDMRRFGDQPLWAASDALNALLGAPSGTLLIRGS